MASASGVGPWMPIDLNRPADRPQLQLVTDANSTSIHERFRQRDLKLARHLRHEHIIAFVKDVVKDCPLTKDGARLDTGRVLDAVPHVAVFECVRWIDLRNVSSRYEFCGSRDVRQSCERHACQRWSGTGSPALASVRLRRASTPRTILTWRTSARRRQNIESNVRATQGRSLEHFRTR